MVRRGEYLERAVVVPGGPRPIEGLFHRGARVPPTLFAPPDPAAGSMESPIIAELAWAVTRAGHATLRFNYPGAGASGGDFDGVASGLEAGRRAAEHLRLCVAPPASGRRATIALCGVGFGAEVVARLALEDAARGLAPPLVVLVLPDPAALPSGLAALTTDVVLVAPAELDAERRAALRTLAEGLPSARLATIPQADRAFLRGLVELGRVVADAVAAAGP